MSETVLMYAGNLDEEIEEIKKMTAQNDGAEQVNTFSEACGAFFTIYCC